jgi:1-acylglycerone phosphate reductase
VYASSRRAESIGDFKSPDVEKLALDVNSDENVATALAYIVEREGKIDVVVNNAGVVAPGPIVEQSINDAKRVFETNVFAILRVCKAVAPIMAKRKSGTIVNVGSIVGEIATPWNGIYCASKASVNSISEVLFMELKPLGINVLHVAPGGVRSNIANNGIEHFSLGENTLYNAYLPDIIRRINASQSPKSMPNNIFAEKVVKKVLASKPPRYLTLGHNATVFSIMKWLPRTFVLLFLWRSFSKRK